VYESALRGTMDNILIATFDNETSAMDGMHKLDAVAIDGNIDLYERAVIRKKPDGRLEVNKGDASADWRTLAGATLGSLVGLLGGPVGFGVGLMAGAVAGSAVGDIAQYSFGQKIREAVGTKVPAGSISIVAHVGEKGSSVLEDVLKPFGATIQLIDIDDEKTEHARGKL